MAQKHLMADLSSLRSEALKLAYLDCPTSSDTEERGTLLLIHGFPQTSHQFRHAVPLLTHQGYRCIVPDYRGAGASSKPESDFRKSAMAADMIALLDYLGLEEPVHVIGHDIGGMIAYAMAARWPERVESVVWGECPLPGTNTYQREQTEHAVHQFHFIFHAVPDLPETLIAGKERLYISHFLHKITYNLAAFGEADVDFYAAAYAQPGAMRCALGVYRAFEEDAKENRDSVEKHGKCRVPTLVLSGARSRHRVEAEEMALEVTEKEFVEVDEVEEAAHYLAEENPQGFARAVLGFLDETGSAS